MYYKLKRRVKVLGWTLSWFEPVSSEELESLAFTKVGANDALRVHTDTDGNACVLVNGRHVLSVPSDKAATLWSRMGKQRDQANDDGVPAPRNPRRKQ